MEQILKDQKICEEIFRIILLGLNPAIFFFGFLSYRLGRQMGTK